MDFTLVALNNLLGTLKGSGYNFKTVRDYESDKAGITGRLVVLRHDIDRKPLNALACAQMEAILGIAGTYYFRITSESFVRTVIMEIESLGHEIGYHYEDLDIVSRRNENIRKRNDYAHTEYLAGEAYNSFCKNLEMLREIAPVTTACMHGSPKSCYDSRLIWKYNDYSNAGIICEPYFDIPLEDILYLTDTGRRWNGATMSIRDRIYARDMEFFDGWVRKPVPGSAMAATETAITLNNRFRFRKTEEIIRGLNNPLFPERLMLTIHPQRWNSGACGWIRELVGQNVRNAAKFSLRKIRNYTLQENP